MTCQEIIQMFELYVDDTTELSTAEELAMLNRVYQNICDDRPWEFLKKEASGTMLSTTTITAPTDFGYFVENRNYTDNSMEFEGNSKPVGVLINGTNWLKIINWSDRKQYLNNDGYAYYEPSTGLVVTTYAQPSGATYSFDYKSVPADLIITESPAFPDRFHPMIALAMASEDMSVQLFDKARSYARENEMKYGTYLQRMAKWNADLQNI